MSISSEALRPTYLFIHGYHVTQLRPVNTGRIFLSAQIVKRMPGFLENVFAKDFFAV